nr:DNA translocase FtsK [Scatolibacter rhodanostii]
MTIEKARQLNQVRAVVLFAVAILLGSLILIPGESLWNWTHKALLGVFGGWAIIAPILMIYVSIASTLETDRSSMRFKVWMTVLIILICCTTGYIFAAKMPETEIKWTEYIPYLYQNHIGVEGGVIGGLIGKPIVAAAGELGSKILIVLFLFVSVMILTGTNLIQLFKTIKKPVDVVSDGIQNARQRREEEREILRSQEINIPLEDELPSSPVRSESSPLFPKAQPEKKVKKQPSEKLEKLKEVFGIAEHPDKQHVQPPVENTAVVFPEPEEKDVLHESIPAIKPMKREIHEESAPEPIVPVSATATRIDPTADVQVAREAEKAAAEFIKKHAEDEKKELSGLNMYNSIKDLPGTYSFPPITMLEVGKRLNPAVESEELQTNGRILVETLKSFGVQTKILDICRGPSVTRYELQPAAGVKISKITNLSDDLAMNLAAIGVRIEAPIPGKAAVGIEVPNKTKSTVRMRELIESNSFITAKSKLTVALGRDIAGQVQVADLGKMPHVLIAGTTGSGKSVCINSLIVSLLYKSTPDEVRFLMIDPKVVELGIYNGVPHLLVPVVTDPRKAAGALGWAVTEMLNRYKMFAECNVRDLHGYNALAKAQNYEDENGQPMLKMPQIVIIIDELSDLMMAAPNEVEDAICRLAQMARAAGMHLVVATQRPSVDVVTGLIKANIPSRIAFAVSSSIDSRTILDTGGAEKLLGQGDMLFAPVGASKPHRIQGCFVSDSEIESIVEFVKSAREMKYDEKVIEEIERNAVAEPKKSEIGDDTSENQDPMLSEAIKCVVEAGQASTSQLQRRLRLGYARAGRLIDEMEQMGIVGPHEGSKPRQVLMTYAQWLESNMQKQDEVVNTIGNADEESE